MKDSRVVYGGGSAEIACGLAVREQADKVRDRKTSSNVVHIESAQ